jgi:(1->4)-alpha-D-glucan 1-alpha-D-glucosylmutase
MEQPSSLIETGDTSLTEEQARTALKRAMSEPPAGRVPSSTYRVQFEENFTFETARRSADYLRRLGVGDLYGSPYFHAISPHGYDINDHSSVNPALGGEEAYREMVEELQRQGMGHVMDVVPNHMGIQGGNNAWWNDVLENGPASPYAQYFDILWHPLKSAMHGQVLLPILGDQYGRVLENGELHLELSEGGLQICYWERSLPIAPGTYGAVLQLALENLQGGLPDDDDEGVIELQSILTAISNLPRRGETEAARLAERQREKEVIKRRIARLMEEFGAAREAIESAVTTFNGTKGEPRSFDRLDALIQEQPYRLAFWRVAAEEINYRRFFDINDLAAIRMEVPEVFAAAHRLVMQLVAEGAVTGLRIDHPDGLWDPAGYFSALQRAATVAWAREALEAEFGPLEEDEVALLEEVSREMEPRIAEAQPLYLLAEKIVEHGEEFPTEWAIHGTTGYEFLNVLGGLFVDRSSEKALTQTYERFLGTERLRFDDIVYNSKRRILRTALASELSVLAHRLNELAEKNRRYRDFTLGNLTEVLREIVATFPVYRSYIDEETVTVSQHDREAIEKAVRLARWRNPDLDPTLFEFMRGLLLLELPDADDEALAEQRRWVMKFQQLTGPVMAKGLEDTSFYIYNRLVSLNEVGGDPKVFGTRPAEFHRHNHRVRAQWPHTMLTTSTHDTKRSEDVRARISVLSEMVEAWRAALTRWSRHNRPKKRQVEEQRFPSRNDEYLLYQSLLGAWPLEAMDDEARESFVGRVAAYMGKAAKEAKVYTSWINENQAYDEALDQFVRAVLADEAFLADIEPLQRQVALFGAINSLAQVTLKFTAPGVPDLYQGNETWDFSLVDPDNRRPVDFEARAAALDALERQAQGGTLDELARDLLDNWKDGRIKLWVTHRALAHRRENLELYRDGDYQPLEASGPAAEHVVAYGRTLGEQAVIVVAPRLMARLAERSGVAGTLERPFIGAEPWRGTTLPLPAGRYRNLFTGEIVESDGQTGMDEILNSFPVALLERQIA